MWTVFAAHHISFIAGSNTHSSFEMKADIFVGPDTKRKINPRTIAVFLRVIIFFTCRGKTTDTSLSTAMQAVIQVVVFSSPSAGQYTVIVEMLEASNGSLVSVRMSRFRMPPHDIVTVKPRSEIPSAKKLIFIDSSNPI